MSKCEINLKEFLTDLRCGSTTQYLIAKYKLDAKKIERVCRKLNQPDLTAALDLWECGKLTDTQFTRAFTEVRAWLDKEE